MIYWANFCKRCEVHVKVIFRVYSISQHYSLKGLSSTIKLLLHFVKSLLVTFVYFGVIYSVPLIYAPIPLSLSLDYFNLKSVSSCLSLHLQNYLLVSFFCFFSLYLFLSFHTHFRIILSISVKHSSRILIGIMLNLYISLGRIDIFTILYLPTHEHGMSCHVFKSLMSFISSNNLQYMSPLYVLLYLYLCIFIMFILYSMTSLLVLGF